MEAPEIEFITDLQGNKHILLHRCGLLILGDNLSHLLLAHIHAPAHKLLVKSLGPDGEEGRVESQRAVDLKPGDAKRHHHIGYCVSLRKEVSDFFTGVDVPIRDARRPHLLLRSFGQAPALSDRLHDLERALGRHPLGDKEQHNVITTAYALRHAARTAHDNIPGIAQPYIRTVGKTGDPKQHIKLGRLRFLQHPTSKSGVELRNGYGASGPQYLVVLKPKDLG